MRFRVLNTLSYLDISQNKNIHTTFFYTLFIIYSQKKPIFAQ